MLLPMQLADAMPDAPGARALCVARVLCDLLVTPMVCMHAWLVGVGVGVHAWLVGVGVGVHEHHTHTSLWVPCPAPPPHSALPHHALVTHRDPFGYKYHNKLRILKR